MASQESELDDRWRVFINHLRRSEQQQTSSVPKDEYPTFAPPLMHSMPYKHTNSVQLPQHVNELVWNEFWRRNKAYQQCDAFGIRPALFDYIANSYSGPMYLIRDQETLEPLTKQIECTTHNDFPRDNLYLQKLDWIKTLSLEELNEIDQRVMPDSLVVGPHRMDRGAGPIAHYTSGHPTDDSGRSGRQPPGTLGVEYMRQPPFSQALRNEVNRPTVNAERRAAYRPDLPKHGASDSIHVAIQNNNKIDPAGKKNRFKVLCDRWDAYRDGRLVWTDIQEPSGMQLLNIAFELDCTQEEARALFLQQRKQQLGQPSELPLSQRGTAI